jgi:NDP-sugar pyrophosphorylase family protein
MNGDVLTTLDYEKLLEAHTHANAWGTIAVKQREVQIDFGVVELDADGDLVAYHEKPIIPYDVSMGINVLARTALDFVPEGRRFDMPDLMRALRAAGKKVQSFREDCYWQDIGRFDDYQRASDDFSSDPSRFLPNRHSVPWVQS